MNHGLPLHDDLAYLGSLDRQQLIEAAALRGQSLVKLRRERHQLTGILSRSTLATTELADACRVGAALIVSRDETEVPE